MVDGVETNAADGQVQPTTPTPTPEPVEQSTQPPAEPSTPSAETQPPAETQPQQPAAPAQPEPTPAESAQGPPRNMPYEAFKSRIDSKNRIINDLKEENARLLQGQQQPPQQQQPVDPGQLSASQRLIADANQSQFDQLNDKLDTVSQQQADQQTRNEYDRMRSQWWNENTDIAVGVKKMVDERLDILVAQGQFIDPNLVLTQAIGERTLQSTRQRGESFANANSAASQANRVATATERTVQAAETTPGEKPVSEMTTEEMEQKWGESHI